MDRRDPASIRFMWFLSLFLAPLLVHAGYDLGFGSGSTDDLTHFVSRPEIKVPKFNVTIHDPDRVTPGYWFVAPYVTIIQHQLPMHYVQPCQTGPAIYDATGELVWTGACRFRNQNACDLRVFRANGTDHLSAILVNGPLDTKGRGVLLDDSYKVTQYVNVSRDLRSMNMHEMNVISEGKTALHIIHRTTWTDLSDLDEFGISQDAGFVAESGFREVDLRTGKTLFEWWALDHVPLSDSRVKIEDLDGPWPNGWNYFHLNSVEKSADGGYMLSARFTDTIYKISSQDGAVLWRLGGDRSSFILQDFNFSRQHDARFVEESRDKTIITFLDNASDGINETSSVSSGLLVALETSKTPMVASVLRRWTRPDDGISELRGNFQLLPNGNVFTGWSDNSYISEHTFDGDLVMTAKWTSERFVSYRAWKYNFTSNPYFPPVATTLAYGVTPETSTTVGYVSWNGATEVASWEVFRNSTAESLGRFDRTGFETMFQLEGFEPSLYVQALSATEVVLGTTNFTVTTKPPNWTNDIDLPMKRTKGHGLAGKQPSNTAEDPISPGRDEL